MKTLSAILRAWLPLALVAVCLTVILSTAVQQSYRMGANDPQIQMAEDAARALEGGHAIDALLPAVNVDIAAGLSPYLIYYGPDGSPQTGSGLLDGSLPGLPAGVFDVTRKSGEDRISWQPRAGVRSAVVVVAVNGGKGGFVMAGRSLREVEKREDNLTLMTGLGLAGTLAASLLLVAALELLPLVRLKS